MNLPDDLKDFRAARKPHFLVVGGRPVQVQQRETKLEAARRRHGKPFGTTRWATGEGPRFWTADRIARLAAANEEHRMERQKKALANQKAN